MQEWREGGTEAGKGEKVRKMGSREWVKTLAGEVGQGSPKNIMLWQESLLRERGEGRVRKRKRGSRIRAMGSMVLGIY